MMFVSNYTLFLVVFLVDFLRAASVSPLGSRPPVTKTRILYIGDDDDYEETPQPSQNVGLTRLTTAQFPPRECEYDPCVVPDVPCSVLSAQTKCYCPGLTGPDQPPESPMLREVKPGSAGEVEVHWCAPLSRVTHYKVMTEDGEAHGSIYGEFTRNGTIKGLKAGSEVCVVAVNDAGDSIKSEKSCARFEPLKTSQLVLTSGIIAGCVGFLILLSLAVVLLWRRKSCRKSGTLDGEGLRNPSYTTNETL
ncbi:LRRN4 C-terminal-like protein [Hoplias malabaricus]|uniref:LRRN4 C-terminal-like protein n=1 Tax=Hoplias malabaricus TaxID=27720 RepID=UPI0034624C13